uniref:Winged helix-turn-helix domain-containing protein n=1 Tax=Heliothis virescens TaxID=7102 RepID=A0A2A4J236_HELVI
MAEVEEKVVMTPKCKTANSTTLVIERKAVEPEASDKIHVAGGDHTGIIINKENNYENGVSEPCHAQLEFYVYLVSGATGTHTREARALRFWFKPSMTPNERPYEAQAFFRELVSPQDFPKDYVGYIKKIMKLMQHKYNQLKLLEVELRQEAAGPPLPAYIEDSVLNQTHDHVISEQRVLDMIENAYPNPLTVEDFVTAGKWSKAEVKDALESLEEKGLTRAMSEGLYVRQHSVDTQVVKQMPQLCSSRQPSIAVITALYCEKQAVDAMMDNQETYVRYTTVGKLNMKSFIFQELQKLRL